MCPEAGLVEPLPAMTSIKKYMGVLNTMWVCPLLFFLLLIIISVIASQAGFYVVEGEALALAVGHALKERRRQENPWKSTLTKEKNVFVCVSCSSHRL